MKLLGSSVAVRTAGALEPIAPSDGLNGASAWTPMLAIEIDGTARYLKVVDWTGGTGTKPAVGYVGTSGITIKANAPNLNAAKRVAFYTGVSIAGGLANVSFTGFAATPLAAVVGAQPSVLLGAVKAEIVAGSVTKDGCQVKVTTASLAGLVSALVGATVTVLTIESRAPASTPNPSGDMSMATAARLALAVRRNEVARFTIAVEGFDLTGVDMAMQIRLAPDTPGAPLMALGTVTTISAEGLKLDSVTVVDGIPTSIIRGRINASTMTDATKVPYSGEVGTDTVLAYAMQWVLGGDAQTRLYGDFIVVASAFNSNAAPANRPVGYGGSTGSSSVGASSTLQFGDQIIRVSLDGFDLLAPLVAKAILASNSAVAAQATVIPRALTVTATTTSGTTDLALTFPAGVTFANGSIIEFRAPSNLAGPLTITTVQYGTVPHKNRDGGEFSGIAYPADTVVRARWNAAGSVWDSYTADLPVYVGQTIGVEASQALDGASLITGAYWAIPVNGNVNNLTAIVPGFLPDMQVPILFLYDTTAEAVLTIKDANNVTRTGPIARGTGVSFPAGEIKRGDVQTLAFSVGGGRFVAFGEPRSVIMKPIVKEDIGTTLASFRAQPYGTIGAGNSVTITPLTISSAGSSVFTDASARQGGAQAGYAPVKVLCDEINAAWPLSGVVATPDNWAKGGSVFEQFTAQLAESSAYVNGTTDLVLLGGGMNDFQIPGYNIGVTYEGARLEVTKLIEAAKAKGMKVLLVTTAHLRTTVVDYAGFYTSNPTAPQVYPRAVAAPVNPETGMYPPASLSKGTRDMTGSGALPEYDVRFWHGNSMLRDVARLYPNDVILLDWEWAWFRYGVEVSGVDSLYGTGEVVHPNIAGHETLRRVLKRFAQDLAAGRLLKRSYRGDEEDLAAVASGIDSLNDAIAGALSVSQYRPSLAAAVADFDVGTFFTSRDTGGVSEYPGVKRQYQIISTAPYWADRGPFLAAEDVGLDPTRDADKPISNDAAAVFEQVIDRLDNPVAQRVDLFGDAVPGAVSAPLIGKLSQRRNIMDFVDPTYWAGIGGSTAPTVAPKDSNGMNSYARAFAEMVAAYDRRLDFPAGFFTLDTAYPTLTTQNAFFHFCAAGSGNTILSTQSATADMIVINDINSRVEGFQLQSQIARTAGYGLRITNAPSRISIDDIVMQGLRDGFRLDGAVNPVNDRSQYYISRMRIIESLAAGTPVSVGGGYVIDFSDCLILNGATRSQYGVKVDRCADMRWKGGQIIGTVYPLYSAPTAGNTVASLKFTSSYNATSTKGTYLSTVGGGSIVEAAFENTYLSEADGGNGFTALGGGEGFYGLEITGQQSVLNRDDGIHVDNVYDLQVTGTRADGNGGAAFAISNCDNPILVAIRAGGRRFGGNGIGLYDSGNTNLIATGNARGNTTNAVSASTNSDLGGLSR